MSDGARAERLIELDHWLTGCRQRSQLKVTPIDWQACTGWQVSAQGIEHRTGGFFSLRGRSSEAVAGVAPAYAQPMIDQPEIGILGFVLRQGPVGFEWLLQAKTEPGNELGTQLAPSVQATESNYKRRHNGAATPLLELFLAPGKHQVLSDTLGSEQGSRFIGKYNRNMSVLLTTAIDDDLGPNLRWCPSQVLQLLLLRDFVLNTDARSSLFIADWRTLSRAAHPFADVQSAFGKALQRSFAAQAPDLAQTLGWLTELRGRPRPTPLGMALAALDNWTFNEHGLQSSGDAQYRISAFAVSTTDREVDAWCQPLVSGHRANLAILYCQEQQGVLRFLLRASWELGFMEGFQLGPSWQSDAMGYQALAIADLRRDSRIKIVCQIQQSDEGGRFINSICRYQIRQLPNGLPIPDDLHYRWLTLADIHAMRPLKGLLTNEARSVLSMLLAWL
ncbi:MAG: NDP-hexose 2,3-dehydratase family protein [Pseudomonas sp.]|uniref:NDP-hexose 2,3-dehydratase family protein n=1 Tax=Pseudomonas sp. TaxID=306 RepID=UPI00339124E5